MELNPSPAQATNLASMPVLVMDDARWANRAPVLRESDVAMQWPQATLGLFRARMEGHGHGVSGLLMSCDRRYALQQLMFAQSLADADLHKLTGLLFAHIEKQVFKGPALH
jgi:hypothetical protein